MVWSSRLVLVALAIAGSGCASADDELSCADFRFEQRSWASLDGNPSPRQRMADHIVACHTLHGKRHSEVRKLLGRPDESLRLRGGRQEISYLIGDERGAIKVDSEWLDLQFQQNRLTEASIGS